MGAFWSAGSLPPWAWVALGAALAAPLVAVGRRLPERTERVGWAVGVVVAALIYVGFTLARSAPALAVAFEAGGVAVFGAIAGLGLRDRRWLAVAWLLHPLWDGLHHPGGFAYGPEWYVWACLAFDVVVGVSLLANGTRGRA